MNSSFLRPKENAKENTGPSGLHHFPENRKFTQETLLLTFPGICSPSIRVFLILNTQEPGTHLNSGTGEILSLPSTTPLPAPAGKSHRIYGVDTLFIGGKKVFLSWISFMVKELCTFFNSGQAAKEGHGEYRRTAREEHL